LLELQLARRRQMLQHAAPACSEVCTARRDAIGRGLEHALQASFIEVAATLQARPFDPLAGQRVVDEHGLAFDARDAAAVVSQVDDLRRFDAAV
jgi:hypothetical protein